MRIFAYEFALSLRRLLRRPGGSLLMLATLSVSLSLSLLGWSLFHTLFLQQPEFDPHGTLLRIGVTGEVTQGRIIQIPRHEFESWRAAQTSFEDFAPAMLYQSTFVTTDRGIERLLGANLSSAALRMVGARPLLGRLFQPEEDKLGSAPVLLLSEKIWRSRFNGDPAIVGRPVIVDGASATVVGVMPDSFRFPNAQDVWQPLGFSPNESNPTIPVLDIVARRKAGVTAVQALDELQLLTKRAGPDTLIARYNLKPVITPFRDYYLHPDMTRSAAILFALSLVFVLVSCANAANLVLIDFLGRTPEIAASLALGVPRAAAIRGLAIQLFITAFAAAIIAFVVLLAAGPYVHSAMSRITTPYWLLFALQPHHVMMALVLAIGSAAIAIVVPVSTIALTDAEKFIRRQTGSTRTTARGWWRRTLLIGQIALLTILAVSAGLLMRSTNQVRPDRWGFDATRIIAAKTSTPASVFATPEVRLRTHQRLLDELEARPSVSAAGLMTNPIGFSHVADVAYGRSPDEVEPTASAGTAVWSAVTPNLFVTLGVPFIEGETFKRDEPIAQVTPVIITAGVARRLWPGQSAVGRALYLRFTANKTGAATQCVVRGVLREFQAAGPKTMINEALYTPIQGGMFMASFLYVRGKDAAPLLADLRTATNQTDPRMAIYFTNTLQSVIDTELSSVHLTTRLATSYALAAVLLCMIGIYSITIAQVMQRHREFGIRLALGIDAARLWRQFARGHLVTAAIGVTIGIAGGAAVAKAMTALLFGVTSSDLPTYLAVIVLILGVSAAACVPSLFRMRRVNPADCLRSL